MAQPFLRIDLSNQAKDFQNTVIEAGWPLIDKANSNYQILRKWLGGAVGEPERKGEEVVFYLRNEAGQRIDQPNVTRASDKDLMGPLKADFQALVKSLEKAEPKNASEKNLHAKALQELQSLATEKRAGDRRCCLFKYRDDNKKWHLVWAPGYRRKDEQPANPHVCTNPACSLLFLERASGNAKCPRCQKTPGERPPKGGGVKKSPLPLILVLLLLVAVLGGGGWWYFNRDQGESVAPAEPTLAVTPDSAKITQDGRIEYTVTFTDAEGNKKDVTDQTSVTVEDLKIAKYHPHIRKIVIAARSTGKTGLEFYYNDGKQKFTQKSNLVVEAPHNPKRVTIQPANVKLGIGTTAQLKMMGEYEDGRQEDLTTAADWNWEDPGQNGKVFAYKGAIQGVNMGKTRLKARYRATPKSKYVIAEAEVVVEDIVFKALHMALGKPTVAVGEDPGITVEVESETGDKLSVLGSALLKLEVLPKKLADVQKQPPYLYPLEPGQGTLRATFRGISKEIPFEVGNDPRRRPDGGEGDKQDWQVHPQNLKLAVGEIADIDVPRGGTEETRMASSARDVVEVTPKNRLVGKKPGKAQITVSQGDQKATVQVEVAMVAFRGLALDPSEVSVRVDDVVALRLLAKTDADTQVEVDPQLQFLEWVEFPEGDYLEFNREALDVRRLRATGDEPKTLMVRLGKHEATAKIRVIPGPLELSLRSKGSKEIKGEIEVPMGQSQDLEVFATYGNGKEVKVPADRVEWLAPQTEGLTLQKGKVTADKPQAGPLVVSVKYQGQTSNEVQIRAGHAGPIKFSLAANPAKLPVQNTGQLILSGKTPGGEDVQLDMAGVKFASEDESIVTVDPITGGFRGGKRGQSDGLGQTSHFPRSGHGGD